MARTTLYTFSDKPNTIFDGRIFIAFTENPPHHIHSAWFNFKNTIVDFANAFTG